MLSFKKTFKGLLPLLLVMSCHEGYESRQLVDRDNLMEVAPVSAPPNTEEYSKIVENEFKKASEDPLSTFSVDVDRAAYSNVRRFINAGTLPPKDAVRLEEMINYFDYDYAKPTGKDPVAVNTEISNCPWNNKHLLVHIGLKGKEIAEANLTPANLVFLVDVSGSMASPDKLPLVKQSLLMLTDRLRTEDRVAIVTYAGSAGIALKSTSGKNKTDIKEAIEELESGGSTAGAEGIITAYKIAQENFIRDGGNNRVIIATDGDFNVGPSSDEALVALIEEKRKSNIFLTVLGFGTGNYKDGKMQLLADKGNGNHVYIDNENEAKKVLVNEFGSNLFTIAKDVKIQVEFKPANVGAYRLLGYENRMLQKEDFNDDRKDAGEIGSGHTVTALYEIIPAGIRDNFLQKVDPLKYTADKKEASGSVSTDEILTIKIRYKDPESNESKLLTKAVKKDNKALENSSDNFRFAAAVAEFGMLLRDSEFKQKSSYENVISLAKNAQAVDKDGYRKEFIELAEAASSMEKTADLP